MESTNAVHQPQASGQSPFFYYNPDPHPEHRQHGHFSPHPSGVANNYQLQQFPQQAYRHQEVMMQAPPHVLYSRPSSSDSQFYVQPKTPFSMQSTVTPMASPRPLPQKSTFLGQHNGTQLSLNTECDGPDVYFYPSTPPLSTSGSAISSPPSTCGVLPTPVHGLFFGLENIEGVKEGCESEVQSEILAGADFTCCGSPPLTPGMSSQNSLCCSYSNVALWRCGGFFAFSIDLIFFWCYSVHSPTFAYPQPSI